MALTVKKSRIPEVLVFEPDVFKDDRGFFMETFHARKYRALGLERAFVQDNYSHSCGGTLRGLHYQIRHPQAKLISVIHGKIFDVAVDIRRGSPTFGQWVGQVVSDENRCQFYIPEGFAHGFCVLSDKADVTYKCTDFYDASDDHGILWSDPDVGIDWPTEEPIISAKDSRHPCLSAVPPELLPEYRGKFLA